MVYRYKYQIFKKLLRVAETSSPAAPWADRITSPGYYPLKYVTKIGVIDTANDGSFLKIDIETSEKAKLTTIGGRDVDSEFYNERGDRIGYEEFHQLLITNWADCL